MQKIELNKIKDKLKVLKQLPLKLKLVLGFFSVVIFVCVIALIMPLWPRVNYAFKRIDPNKFDYPVSYAQLKDEIKTSENQKPIPTENRLVQRVASGEARETERMLVDSMTNNQTDFGFCINHSNLGLKLKSRNIKVIEKTGYYPAYTWGLGMADLGYPVVLTQATVFSLFAPDGEVRTFWGFVNTEVPMPWETVLEGGIAFPNDDGSQFMAYIRKIKPNLDSEFRSYITALVRSA